MKYQLTSPSKKDNTIIFALFTFCFIKSLNITNKAVEAGKVLDIEVCDHLIVSPESYLSLKDGGYF